MKKLIGILLAVMLLVFAVSALAEDPIIGGRRMYVYSQDGEPVRVRSSMSTADNSNVRGWLPYGTEVMAYGSGTNGWYLIDYDDMGDSYMMARFLVGERPAPYNPDKPVPTPGTNDFSTKDAATVAQMNTLVKSAKFVTPYSITVRPTRASGWVYLRWFPSKNAAEVATFNGYYELTVLAELKDWYQVSDPATGRIGYIYKSYVQ